MSSFNYTFPSDLVAEIPAHPRDSARLLIYDRDKDTTLFSTFRSLPSFLPDNAVIVFNQTKVIPARLHMNKETGGKVVIFFVAKEKGLIKIMSDRKLIIGVVMYLSAGQKKFGFKLAKQEERFYFLKPLFPIAKFDSLLDKYGKTPIPTYLRKSPLKEAELRKKYQTVFARDRGSVAAPTASLHFTKRLIKELRSKGLQTLFITLHVNMGTFASLSPEDLKSGKLHKEYFEIDSKTARALNRAKQDGRPIIAVGTTVVRALESAAKSPGKLKKLRGKTDLFIREGHRLKFVDQLITNFHVPNSSLLMLVSAFLPREKLLSVYSTAIDQKFRLFSFGDGMYIR